MTPLSVLNREMRFKKPSSNAASEQNCTQERLGSAVERVAKVRSSSPESVPLHQRWMEALLAKEVVVSLWLDQRNPRTLDMLQHRAVRDGEYPQLFSGYQVGRRDSFHRGKEQTSVGLLHRHQNHND